MPALLIFLFFCIFAAILIGCAVAFAFLENQRKKQVKTALQTAVSGEAPAEKPVLLIQREKQDDVLQRLLRRLNLADRLKWAIAQAGLQFGVEQFAMATAVLAVVGLLLGYRLNFLFYHWLSALALGAAGALLPYAYVHLKRKQRFAEFEEQFPEALDFLARSMRAGHAFSISLEMLGQESPEPVGHEFRALFNELNLGAQVEVALTNLVRRVPLIDVRFFVSAVMLQRQTGGNLSEILTRLGYVIRERFRLRGQVKAASAHGRLTAIILTAMPIVMAIALSFVQPKYLQTMANDPDGKYLILGAIVAQVLGYLTIRRIINIKV
jgi:tight adherence protein B